MTTIAYRNGIIAFDSRCTQDDNILSDDFDKAYLADDDTVFILCGCIGDHYRLMDQYFDRPYDASKGAIEASGYVIKSDGTLWRVGPNEGGGVFTFPAFSLGACGSGAPHALTAMDMGASAEDAIAMAAKRDTNTGGAVRTLRYVESTTQRG